MSIIPPFHNPNNLTPSEYGASDGWRLLRQEENVPTGAEYFDGRWQGSLCVGGPVNGKYSYRTRTPDPFAPADEWVKRSEREPTEADLPIIAGSYRSGEWSYSSVWDRVDGPDADRTHWMSIPKPPARELTQAGKDDAAFRAWCLNVPDYGPFDAWRAALAYERARTAK